MTEDKSVSKHQRTCNRNPAKVAETPRKTKNKSKEVIEKTRNSCELEEKDSIKSFTSSLTKSNKGISYKFNIALDSFSLKKYSSLVHNSAVSFVFFLSSKINKLPSFWLYLRGRIL